MADKILVPGELETFAQDGKLVDAKQVKDIDWKGVSGTSTAEGNADQHTINEELRNSLAGKVATGDAFNTFLYKNAQSNTGPKSIGAKATKGTLRIFPGKNVNFEDNGTTEVEGSTVTTGLIINVPTGEVKRGENAPVSGDAVSLAIGEINGLEGALLEVNGNDLVLKDADGNIVTATSLKKFAKDGMLVHAVYITPKEGEVTNIDTSTGLGSYTEIIDDNTSYVYRDVKVGGKYLGFVWNTDLTGATSNKTTMVVDVSDLVDTYTAGGGISIDNNQISAYTGGKWVEVRNSKIEGTERLDSLETDVNTNINEINALNVKTQNLVDNGTMFQGTAQKAVMDADGNDLAGTYAKLTDVSSAVLQANGFTEKRTGLRFLFLTGATFANGPYNFAIADSNGNKATLGEGDVITDVRMFQVEDKEAQIFKEIQVEVQYPSAAVTVKEGVTKGAPIGIPSVYWQGLDAPTDDTPLVLSYRVVHAGVTGAAGESGEDTGATKAEVTALTSRVSTLETSVSNLTQDAERHATTDEVRKVQEAATRSTARLDRLEQTEAIRQDYSSLPLLCGQPPILFGHGAPSADKVPANWTQYDPLTDTGYNWNGLPSAIGQRYINVDAATGGLYIAGETDIDNPSGNLKWYNV